MRKLGWVAASVAVTCAVAACGGSGGGSNGSGGGSNGSGGGSNGSGGASGTNAASAGAPTKGGEMVMAFPSDPDTFDPQVCCDAPCWDNMEMLFNRLFDYR